MTKDEESACLRISGKHKGIAREAIESAKNVSTQDSRDRARAASYRAFDRSQSIDQSDPASTALLATSWLFYEAQGVENISSGLIRLAISQVD